MARSASRRKVLKIPGQSAPLVLEEDAPDGSGTAATGDLGSHVQRGSRPVKEYYIYDSEFRELKKTGAIATSLFAIGSAALGFAVNVHTGMTFAENVAAAVKLEWTIYRNTAFIVSAICYLLATIQALSGYNQVEQIKAQTSHGTEKYVPKPWYKILLWVLAVFGAAIIGMVLGKAL
jgi:hypothetical protein